MSDQLEDLVEELTDDEGLIKRMVRMLIKLEFSHHSRYGENCPVCGGLQYGGVDSEAGPDRGHEEDCELRALLDEMGGKR